MSRVATIDIQFRTLLDESKAKYDEFKKYVEAHPPTVSFGGASGAGNTTLGGLPTGGPAGQPAFGPQPANTQQMLQQMIAAVQNIPTIIAQGFAGVAQQAAGAAGAPAAGAGGAGAAGGRAGWGQITRKLTAGYAAREILGLVTAGQQLDASNILAGGDQVAQARAQLAFSKNIGGQFFGFGDLVTGGATNRAQTERILADAEEQGQYDSAARGGGRLRRNFRDEASQAGAGSSYERSGLALAARKFERSQSIFAQRQSELDASSKIHGNRIAEANRKIAAGGGVASNMVDTVEAVGAQWEVIRAQKEQGQDAERIDRLYAGAFANNDAVSFYEETDRQGDRYRQLQSISNRTDTIGLRTEHKYDAADRFAMHQSNLRRLDEINPAGRANARRALDMFGRLTGLGDKWADRVGYAVPDAELLRRQTQEGEAEEQQLDYDQKYRQRRLMLGLSTHAAQTAALKNLDPTSAHVASIVGGGIAQAGDFRKRGDNDLADQSLKNTISDLELTRAQYLQQFHAVGVGKFEDLSSPRDTEDSTKIMQTIADGIQELKTELKNLVSN